MKISKKAVDVRLNSINKNFFVAVRYERKWHKVLYSIELCKLLACRSTYCRVVSVDRPTAMLRL